MEDWGEACLGLLALSGFAAAALLPRLVVKGRLDGIAGIWKELGSESTGIVFSEDLLGDLPEPVQRYFRHAIRPGTLIHDGAILHIEGSMKLRPGGGWGRFLSRERIQAGRGLLWPAVYSQGLLQIAGIDAYMQGQGRSEWWLLGMITVARAQGSFISESAAGRMAAEMIWLPGMLLPQFGTQWTVTTAEELCCSIFIDGFSFELHYRIDSRGALQAVRMQRLRRLDDGSYRHEAFGMDSDGEFSAEGMTVPGRCRVAWQPDDQGQRFEFWQGEIRALQYSGQLPAEGCLSSSPLDRFR